MLILASSSPRRRELLSLLGLDFSIVKPEIDEHYNDISPDAYVTRLAKEKAQAILKKQDSDIIIAADTTVVLDKDVLNKPRDRNDAMNMLSKLSGKTHQVLTGFCVANKDGDDTQIVSSEVTFKKLDKEEIHAYCNTSEPFDKAGAYAIQGVGSMFISHLVGSYSGVMGLPIFELCESLKRFGLSPLSNEVLNEG